MTMFLRANLPMSRMTLGSNYSLSESWSDETLWSKFDVFIESLSWTYSFQSASWRTGIC